MAALPLIVGMLTGIYYGIAARVEDPALFLSLGLRAFWLWMPRFITAVIAAGQTHLISVQRSDGVFLLEID